uniref:dTDP-4-dehydrorhamnose 3,5-epimerase family protein n=1 Tax=Gordonia sp. B7-2 TaxID=3420932 RepID=UPI003D93CEFA
MKDQSQEAVISPFEINATCIDGLLLISMKEVFEPRGVVREFFRMSSIQDSSLASFGSWQQINITDTRRGAIRGLHAENMNKLVGVANGSAFGVYVDVRRESLTCGAVFTVQLTPGTQIFVPKGVCNGFQSTVGRDEDYCQYIYCFDEEWSAGMPGVSLNPLDGDLGIDWPITVSPDDRNLISAKDVSAPSLKQLRG